MNKRICDFGMSVLACVFAVASVVAVCSGNLLFATLFFVASFVAILTAGIIRYRESGKRSGLVCAALSGLCLVTYLVTLKKRFK